MNRLVIESISRNFGGVQALDDVSFVVEPGTIHGLIGPNGAGKTTLINVLSGLLPPSSGRMSYKNYDLHRLAVHQMAAIGIARTFQNIRLFPHLSCLQNVQAGQHLTSRRSLLPRLLQLPSARREDRRLYERAMEMLGRVGLDQKANYQSRNLSYGERRRLEIARALSLNPSLLLLDEPVAGMRQGEAAVVAELLRSLCREGMTILLIEHNMSFVMSLCSRITVLDFGKVLYTGTPAEVRASHEVIEAYLGAGAPMLDVSGLTVSYGHVEAVREVSFHVDQGEIVSLVGPNGAGKTTILNAISGVRSRDAWNHSISGKRYYPREPPSEGLGRNCPNPRGAVGAGKHDRPGKPGTGGIPPAGGRDPGDYCRHGETLPDPRRASQVPRRHPFRRGAADAGHCPRSHGEAETSASG